MPPVEPTADTGIAVTAGADAHVDSFSGAGAGSTNPSDIGTDAASGAGSGADAGAERGADGHAEDTMDLRLPDELLALVAEEATGTRDGSPWRDQDPARCSFPLTTAGAASGLPYEDLLDRVADWGPAETPSGVFRLVPVRVERDLQ
ncbi:N-acetyltransferase, partial [Streptomyces cellulosae]